jgi:dienelactone hydrolase
MSLADATSRRCKRQPPASDINGRTKQLQLLCVAVFLLALPGAATAAGPADVRAALRSEPFFTEVFAPSHPAEGVVITLHRGAWSSTGRDAAATEHADDRAWLRRRWLVVNSSYRPGVLGLADVRSVYIRVRRALGNKLPLCLVGASSGGTLALLAATRLPQLDCLVAEAAPTDLLAPGGIHDLAAQALGEQNLRAFSPLFVADRIKADVLVAGAQQDPLVPQQQLSDLCTRLASRCAGFLSLAPGPLFFVHAGVERGALSRFRRAETALASSASG